MRILLKDANYKRDVLRNITLKIEVDPSDKGVMKALDEIVRKDFKLTDGFTRSGRRRFSLIEYRR